MSRPMLLVFLLLILIITSQFEWKQQLIPDPEAINPSISSKQQRISKREEAVKQKIILSQERRINSLNELVQSLQQQLLHCRGSNKTTHSTVIPLTEWVIELE